MVVVMAAAKPTRREIPGSSLERRSKRALNDYSVEVGRRIISSRRELGITQEELAELAGVSQRSMQAYETGEVIPYRKMREIAAVLKVSPSWVLHGEDTEDENAELKRQIENLTKLVRSMSKKLDRLQAE